MAGRSRILTYGLPLLAAAGLVSAVISIARNTPDRRLTETADLPPTQPSSADAEKSGPGAKRWIGAVGVIESASEEIAIGTQLSGVVDEVMVKAGDKVAKGDPLFRIDDLDYRVALSQAEASLAVAKADLPSNQKSIEQQRSVAEQVRATIEVLDAEVQRAEKDRDRGLALSNTGNLSRQSLDTRIADALKALGSLRSGRAAGPSPPTGKSPCLRLKRGKFWRASIKPRRSFARCDSTLKTRRFARRSMEPCCRSRCVRARLLRRGFSTRTAGHGRHQGAACARRH
jgi:HlyD family secretion protein